MASSGIQGQIIQEANSQGVPSSIALAVAQEESGFNPNVIGSAGEVGVFQLLPSSFPGQAISDLGTNISLGVGYLRSLYQQFGDWATAIAAYNAGPGDVSKGIIPASTQSYVSKVLANAGSVDPGPAGPDYPMTDDSIDASSLPAMSLDPSIVAPLVLGGVAIVAWLVWG